MGSTIYVNGQIVTVDENLPGAEAVVVKNGRIVYVGSRERALTHKAGGTRIVDLEGKAMLPGFIDPHSHFITAMVMSGFISLSSPPIGGVRSINDIVEALKKDLERKGSRPGSVIVGWGFDESRLKEGCVPTKNDLDRVSTEHMVYAIHQSGHTGVGNSAVLANAGIDETTENPEGGVIGRIAGTNTPNGVLEETVHMEVLKNIFPKPRISGIGKMFRRGTETYVQQGITTAQDGALNKQYMILVRLAIALRLLKIDIVGYYGINSLDDFLALDKMKNLKKYRKRIKIGGAKFFLDGSPQAKTAWLSKPYHVPPEGKGKDYRGYPFHEDDGFVTRVYEECLKRDLQVLTHTNGDQASEQLITCFEAARKNTNVTTDVRPVMIHAQTVREDQLDRMKELKMIPSFFQVHTFFWGDWHINSVLGKERAYRISPVQSAIKRDMVYTLHQDTPVVPPNMIFTLWSSVNRKTRSGEVIGPDQCISVLDAIKGITINGAYQYFEEDSKGTITAGKRADLVILDKNPLTVEPDAIKEIKVLETIKDGKTIFSA
ncbi:MAG: amidohydrolase [Spirochaetaceae bacterium]|nr:amidohydrolase [Spirochaetaceae bacterium]